MTAPSPSGAAPDGPGRSIRAHKPDRGAQPRHGRAPCTLHAQELTVVISTSHRADGKPSGSRKNGSNLRRSTRHPKLAAGRKSRGRDTWIGAALVKDAEVGTQE